MNGSVSSSATRTGTMPFEDGHTWYRVTGELGSGAERAPLVILHGGPGASHDYTLPMAGLAGDGRAVIHYDQFGGGNSSHRPDWPSSAWTVELFVAELAALVDHLGLGGGFHLLGQSWGGMLASEYVLRHPQGVKSLSICDSPASMELWTVAADELRARLPADVAATLTEHELAGTTDSPEYRAATAEYYQRHVCRVVPMPPEVARTFELIDEDPTVYHAMNGPNEFHVIGSLRTWSVVDRLPGITAPTLVIAGEFDEAAPSVWAPFATLIPGARSHVIPDASHLPHIENPAEFNRIVAAFLQEND